MKKTVATIIFASLICAFNISTAQAFWFFSGNQPKASNEVKQQAKIFSQEDNKLRPEIVQLALTAYNSALQKGVKINKPIITIIDYSLNSNLKRLWVLDLHSKQILFNSLVAHGKYTGNAHAYNFSDQVGSLESSLGLFLTKNTYTGHNGYTLKIAGLENGFNTNAEERHIVIHGAWYASEQVAQARGQIGRSWGCPAVEPRMAEPIISTIKNGTLVFAYYPNKSWLDNSNFINGA